MLSRAVCYHMTTPFLKKKHSDGVVLTKCFAKSSNENTFALYREIWRALQRARGVPETLVLRDFHVDNLIRVGMRDGIAACGLLDFQDAVKGPVTYDLISLLEDARRDVPDSVTKAIRTLPKCFPRPR